MRTHETQELVEHGVQMPVPEAVWVDALVDLDRIGRDVVLFPGTRIEGEGTVLGDGCRIGTLGPVFLKDVAAGRGVVMDRGSAESCTLLDRAHLGPDSHVREGSLLEEDASVAHSVGLKQTILLAHATLGSQVNFCDCILYGGRSRVDHSEVGSGFIHFNFTPFGASGDKVTASLFGDVQNGVLMDRDRVFLGGSGGVVGPVEIGFGVVLAAGTVYRRDYGDDVLVLGEALEPRVRKLDLKGVRRLELKLERTVRYLGQLRALEAWYRLVRLPAATDSLVRLVLQSAQSRIRSGINERIRQAGRLLENAEMSHAPDAGLARKWEVASEQLQGEFEGTGDLGKVVEGSLVEGHDHVAWVRGLDEQTKGRLSRGLNSIVDEVLSCWSS